MTRRPAAAPAGWAQQPRDLFAIHLRRTGSGRVEVHVLASSTGWTEAHVLSEKPDSSPCTPKPGCRSPAARPASC